MLFKNPFSIPLHNIIITGEVSGNTDLVFAQPTSLFAAPASNDDSGATKHDKDGSVSPKTIFKEMLALDQLDSSDILHLSAKSSLLSPGTHEVLVNLQSSEISDVFGHLQISVAPQTDHSLRAAWILAVVFGCLCLLLLVLTSVTLYYCLKTRGMINSDRVSFSDYPANADDGRPDITVAIV